MSNNLVISHVSPTQVCRKEIENTQSFNKQDLFYELSYVLLKGDFLYSCLDGKVKHKVKLKAYWTKIVCRVMETGRPVTETVTQEGPVSIDFQKAKEFCDFLSQHCVFPEHLVSVFEDQVISADGGIDYCLDFDQAMKREVGLPKRKQIIAAL